MSIRELATASLFVMFWKDYLLPLYVAANSRGIDANSRTPVANSRRATSTHAYSSPTHEDVLWITWYETISYQLTASLALLALKTLKLRLDGRDQGGHDKLMHTNPGLRPDVVELEL
jgi:hypothetical protein